MGQGIGYIKDLQLVIPAIRGCMGLHDARVVVILFWAMYMYHGTLIRGQRQLMANLDMSNNSTTCPLCTARAFNECWL